FSTAVNAIFLKPIKYAPYNFYLKISVDLHKNAELNEAYLTCTQTVRKFRQAHMGLADKFIIQQIAVNVARVKALETSGTGGQSETSFGKQSKLICFRSEVLLAKDKGQYCLVTSPYLTSHKYNTCSLCDFQNFSTLKRMGKV
ncbi:hypothetical protein X801_08864, partial [Opisthorchis viverrini]